MLLAVDVGNTNIVLGVYDNDQLRISWRISTNRLQTGDEYGVILKNLFSQTGLDDKKLTGMIVSSVVPPLMFSLEEMAKRYFNLEPLFVGPGMKTGLNIATENPREVGADRIVNAVAGIELYGGPLIIVDFGTATTFDAVSESGDYLGGAISPGISISTEALFQRAAKAMSIRNTMWTIQSSFIMVKMSGTSPLKSTWLMFKRCNRIM